MRALGTALLTALASAGLAAPGAHADMGSPLTARSTTVFTVAGGGTRAPRDGVVATQARLHLSDVAAFAHGGALLQTFGNPNGGDDRGPLWRLDPSGVLRAVPGLAATSAVTAVPDGSMAYAVVKPASGPKRGTQLVRIDPAGAVTPFVDLKGTLDGVELLVAQADGSLLAADQQDVYRVAPDGTTALASPRTPPVGGIDNLFAQPDGSYLILGDHDRLTRIAPDAGVRRAAARLGEQSPFAALTDGSLLGASAEGDESGDIDLIDPLGRAARRRLVADRPGAGDGDGGIAATMRLTLRDAVSTPEQGLLAIDEGIGAPDALFLDSQGVRDGSRLRLLSPLRTTPPAAVAITPATYASHTLEGVSFLTGQPGKLTLSALRPHTSHVLATVAGVAPGGTGELAFRKALPPGRYDLQLDVTGADGSRGTAYAHVETTRALTLARARATVDERQADPYGEGSFIGVGRCARLAARRVTCPVEEITFGPRGHSQVIRRTCQFRETVRLENDGEHVADGRC